MEVTTTVLMALGGPSHGATAPAHLERVDLVSTTNAVDTELGVTHPYVRTRLYVDDPFDPECWAVVLAFVPLVPLEGPDVEAHLMAKAQVTEEAQELARAHLLAVALMAGAPLYPADEVFTQEDALSV